MNTDHEIQLILCPECRENLYLPLMGKTHDLRCPHCGSTYAYRVFRLREKSMRQLNGQLWEYKLWIQHADQKPQALAFRLGDQQLSFFRNDRLLILRNDNRSLALITNMTEGWSRYYQRADLNMWLVIGGGSLGLGLVSMIFFGWVGLLLMAALGVFVAYVKYKQNRYEPTAQQLNAAKHYQDCLALIYDDYFKLSDIRYEFDKICDVIRQLERLVENSGGLLLSQSRFNILKCAIVQTRQHQNNLSSLIQRYESKNTQLWSELDVRNLTAMTSDSIMQHRLKSKDLEKQYQAELNDLTKINTLLRHKRFSE